MTFKPRRSQAEILKYNGGTMGISAVPGSGKTHTLSALAADLIQQLLKNPEHYQNGKLSQEILIVTFSNAAVSNFNARIAGFLSGRGMIPGIGYQVCTLHSMAAEIVRGHSQASGLDPDFVVLDEVSADTLLQRSVDLWLEKDQRETFEKYIKHDLNDVQRERNYKEKWRQDVINIVRNVISQAKDYLMTPEDLLKAADQLTGECDPALMRMVGLIYENYQTQLRLYPALDFADLMFYAHKALSDDAGYLAFLQERWPYILEDEAQDSSMIQEKVLRLLTGKHHNWVRVGDPNQAINETFTTADPHFLKDFLKEAQKTVDLKEAGRSTRSVLVQANRLIQWTSQDYPNPVCRSALVAPYIRLTDPGDSQGNPMDEPKRIVFDNESNSSQQEIEKVSRLAAIHAQKHPEETIAILVPSNDYGTEFLPELEKYPVEVVEVLKSTRRARSTADILAKALDWLSRPLNTKCCIDLFEMLFNYKAQDSFYLSPKDSKTARDILQRMEKPEDFFYPLSDQALQNLLDSWQVGEILSETLFLYRYLLKRWLDARFLKIDQLVLLIAQDLFVSSEDLCTASQLGAILMQTSRMDPSLRLNAMADEIRKTAAKSNLYPGLRGVESQFDPALYCGKIVVTTFHKAKGLEWDQVYLTSCNSYSFPSGTEKACAARSARPLYIRDRLDLQAEALQMLRVISFPAEKLRYREGEGSEKAWLDSVSERLRLLYVGITRAKRGLYVSWNTGRYNNVSQTLAVQILGKKHKGPFHAKDAEGKK